MTLLALLAGCSSPRHPVASLPAIPAARPEVRASPGTVEKPGETRTNLPAPQISSPRVDSDLRSKQADWVLLEPWVGSQLGWSMQRYPSGTNTSYELAGPGGRLRLTAFQPFMQVDGLQCFLGFPPGASNGTLLVHRRDLEKNVRPILTGAVPPSSGNRTIVVDAGHGGENSGTRSIEDGQPEKEFTLDWALRLAALLKDRGWNVILTRTNDITLSLAERVAVADAVNAGLFVSLHFNSAGARSDHQGIETYCLTPAGLPSTITRDYDDDPWREFPNNLYDDANLLHALRLQRALVFQCGGEDRGVRRARFTGVIRSQARPAVLVEGGYLSNPEEAHRIHDPMHRQCLAEAIAGALGSPPAVIARVPASTAPSNP